MEGMRTCHKCKRTIEGRMVYAGGWVWHPSCYPNQKALRTVKRKRKITRR